MENPMGRHMALPGSDDVLAPVANKARRLGILALVVEDDAVIRQLVVSQLRSKCDSVTAGSVSEARSQIKQHRPDMVFLDIELPGTSGLEFLEELKAMRDVYVVMLSGRAQRTIIDAAMKAGADGFVAKPFAPTRLWQHVEICQRKRNGP